MRFIKILLLLLSLNLATNFTNCFAMISDDDSVTEVDKPGYTSCGICQAKRSLKLNASGRCYSKKCPSCMRLSRGLVKREKRNIQYKNKTSEIYACKFCGCQRKKCTRKNIDNPDKSAYQCLNCSKCGKESSFCTPYNNQIWKKTFCNCKSCSGLIVDFRTLTRSNAKTNEKIPKEEVIKSIICDPEGFDYYCYNCQKDTHIVLKPLQAELICEEYNRCLFSSFLPSFRNIDIFLKTLK